MLIYPPIEFTLANGFLLMIPMLALRYGLPAMIRKSALPELEYFPPVRGRERPALKTYFITTTFLIFSPLLSKIRWDTAPAIVGILVYGLGLSLMILALVGYSQTPGLKIDGIYRFSRNPMCLGYFLIFFGASLLIGSWFHLITVVLYQIAVHFLILSEERWCLEQFGEPYKNYLLRVRRYF